MKKTLATALTVLAMATALCSCGQSKPSASASATAASSQTPDSEGKVKPLISLADKPLLARFQPGMGVPIYEVMEASYGMYHQNMYCYAHQVGNTEYCMEKQYTKSYLGNNRPHFFMTRSAGKVKNGNITRDAAGGVGFFLFTVEGDTINLIQKQPFVPVWSDTEAPNFKYPQLGKEVDFGPDVGSGIEITLAPAIANDKVSYERKVYFGIRNNRVVKYGAFRSAHFNAATDTDLKTSIKTGSITASQSTVYPLEVTVTGKRNGETVSLAPFIFNFDESRNQYIIPPAYIQLMGK